MNTLHEPSRFSSEDPTPEPNGYRLGADGSFAAMSVMPVNVEVRKTTLTNTQSPKNTPKATNTVMRDEVKVLREASPRVVLKKIARVPSVMVEVDGQDVGRDDSGMFAIIFAKLPVDGEDAPALAIELKSRAKS